MPNRLASETSPYLLQHQNNPVDWYPWGPEALERAKAEDKPIFLSIGYSACHWCHVMEHESFESDRIARIMNEHFVCIKVDREERPDLDQIYMNAVQMMTGRGGWPMSVFLTPDLKPFYGGTYWPETSKRGIPGFDQVLVAVADAWKNRRAEAVQQADEITQHLAKPVSQSGSGELGLPLMHHAGSILSRIFDRRYGGFGGAPKFPHAMDIKLALRLWRRAPRGETLEMATVTLDKMATGGIYDHLGGGFARYSVDERWLVPHFEKMLYDNALLTGCYVDAYLATGQERYAQVARETIEYILRDMTDPQGGFYSTEDADSEGHEGKFYVWTRDEVREVLGPERAEIFCYVYDVTDAGNFEGKNILNLPKTIEQCAHIKGLDPEQLKSQLADSRGKLLHARSKRVRPGRDDKVLVSWNGMMIASMAEAASALSEPRYLQAARAAADFVLGKMRRPDGRLLHSWRHGQAKFDAYLDDYTSFIDGLISLYEAGFEERFITDAVALAEIVLRHFSDREQGGFYYTADDHEQLVARNKDYYDGSTPSGNAMAATSLLRLAKLTGRSDFLEAAEGTLKSALGLMQESPTAAGQMLLALDMYLGPTPEIVILGDPQTAPTTDVLADLRRRFIPNKLVACRTAVLPSDTSPLTALFAGKEPLGEPPTVFICENFTCQQPVTGKAPAIEAWDKLSTGAH